jgi:hypothetical protein
LEDLFVRAGRLAVLATHDPAVEEPLMIQLKCAPLRSYLEQASVAGYNTNRP